MFFWYWKIFFQYKKSENLYRLILSLSNKSSDYYYIYNNLGLLYEEQGNIKEAENNFIIGLDMRPDDEILNRSFALLLIKNKKFYIQSGAGIVADSIPEKEYSETVNKAKALISALN